MYMGNNLVFLIGRLAEDLEKDNDNKIKTVIASQRISKNDEGVYETDLIPIELSGNIADTTIEYCKKGDLVGIKGTLASDENKEVRVIVEKLSFLSSQKINEDSNETEE